MHSDPMTSHPALLEITRMFDLKGKLAYGETVNQIEHALQCGALAEAENAPASLVVAAVLHDIGQMPPKDAAAAVTTGTDDFHQLLGAQYRRPWFGPEGAYPVKLHGEAQR